MEMAIDLGPEIIPAALQQLRARVTEMSEGDSLKITVESTDAQQADGVFLLLDEYKPHMDYSMKTDSDGHYTIFARYGKKQQKQKRASDTFAQNRIK